MNEKPNILIVDDDESLCKSMALILEKKGYVTESAGTGQEALEKAQEKLFNVALIDIKLPDMEGVQLIEPLKETHPDIAVIMITGHSSLENAVKSLNEGALAYIMKPMNIDEVLAILKNAIEKQHLIEEKRQAEEQIKASLKEKEVLLRELHHRVKNNMQVISSLLKLQSRSIEDEQVMRKFEECHNQIRSMALVHEKLYMSEDIASVDFQEYIETISHDLFRIYRVDTGNVSLNVEAENSLLNINTAIPCGLIINELISNSLKYAFPGKMKGEIDISLKAVNGNEMELTISDNGIGIPENLDLKMTESLGLQLVTMLVEDQLGGQIKLDRTGGTEFHIKFNRK